MRARFRRAVSHLVDVRRGEGATVAWSFLYFFLVLTSYYILRPIRDEMGVLGGVENLAWLFTGTLVGVLLLHPLFAESVARFPRRRFVPITYRFFMAALLVFYLAFRAFGEAESVWVGRVFFIWVSIFNLFVVSVFWSFMTDVYQPGQGKRLFGLLAVGGTLGAISGASITSLLAVPFGPMNLLLVSALFLELAARASGALGREEGRLALAATADQGKVDQPGRAEVGVGPVSLGRDAVIGGSAAEGIGHVLSSPYLLGIAALMLFFTISSTFLYFQQAELTARAFGGDSESRTRFFANIDLAVNVLTLVTQLFLTGRMLRWLGVAAGLAFLPLVSAIGFGVLAVAPVLSVLVVLQVIRRAGNYAIQRPAREVLYTVLDRTDKYKAKNFNDTFVYRVGDQVGAWSYTFVGALGLGFAGLSTTMVPFSVIWVGLAFWLGSRYRRVEEERAVRTPPGLSAEPVEA